ncbi:MAG: histidinol-phosphate transaminase, partial [Clostridiales bacterium]|nr:histidinol-phosphate transaminase [Clostridiales bacterium]
MPSPYASRLARTLTPYVPGEQPAARRLIKLNTNENPYPPAPAVLEAIAAAAGDLRLYPDPGCAA